MTRDVGRLRDRFEGAIVERREPGWADARQTYQAALEQTPALVAIPAHERDVVTIVEFAKAHGMRIAAQRTGHGAFDPLDDVLLVKTDALRDVEIDASRERVRLQAGATWDDIVPSASALGLAGLHGTSGTACATGYSLGGGVGWYARKLGMSANSVTALEIVTADGRLRRVDHENDPELFWALRGGGGSFGVVTALELRLHPVSEVYAGLLFYQWERANEVLQAWREWTSTVPEEVTSIVRLHHFPPAPHVPEAYRGRSFAFVEAVMVGTHQEGVEWLRPLRDLGPEIDTFAMTPPAGIVDLHMDPRDPLPYDGDHQVLDEIDAAAIDAFVDTLGPGSGSGLVAQIRHIGGACARSASPAGAATSIDGSYLTFVLGLVLDEEMRRANRAGFAALEEALAPWDTGRRYLNFSLDPAVTAAEFYPPDVYARLQELKSAIDPENLFRAANYPIGPPERGA